MKKQVKSIKTIMGDTDRYYLAVAREILEHRPNLWDAAMLRFEMRKNIKEIYLKHESIQDYHKQHSVYGRGFEDGYKYAIDRLIKQIAKKPKRVTKFN